MQTPSRISFSQISLLILGALGVLGFGGIAALLILSGLFNGLTMDVSNEASPLVLGVMLGFSGLLLMPGLWWIIGRMNNRLEPDRKAALPFALWHIPLILLLWAAGLFAGQWAVDSSLPTWAILPFLAPLAVLPPIWLVLSLAARDYDFRPRWRGWSTYTIGTTLGPFLILIAEVLALGMLVVIVAVFIAFQPELLAKFESMAANVQNMQSQEELLSLIGSFAANPVFIFLLLIGVSVLVPLVEESLKPLAVWLFARQLNTRLDGFVLGAVCGAAYAVFETGGVSPAASGEWLALLGARGGTSLLHIATSAWMGSAIVPAFRERKWLQLLGVYGMAILLHGTWNALSIFNGLGPTAEGLAGGEWIVAAGRFSAYGLGAMAMIFLALIIHQQSKFKIQQELISAATPPAPAPPMPEAESDETVIR